MRTRPFGKTGVEVPAIGQGTWNLEQDDRAGAIRALRRGIDLGMTHIDTAEMYGSGRVEEIVGEAIRGRRVFLVTKVLPSNAGYEAALRACERSLRRLGVDRIDVYLLRWRGTVPLAETFRAFEKLRKDGKIAHYGVSNFDVDDLEEARRLFRRAREEFGKALEAAPGDPEVLPDLARLAHASGEPDRSLWPAGITRRRSASTTR